MHTHTYTVFALAWYEPSTTNYSTLWQKQTMLHDSSWALMICFVVFLLLSNSVIIHLLISQFLPDLPPVVGLAFQAWRQCAMMVAEVALDAAAWGSQGKYLR